MASSNGNGHGPAAAPRSGFARTQTAPAESIGAWARQGPSAKAVSTSSILGVSREAMDIFLGRNNITKLPMELWSLHNLTVLSLRNNCLTYIPPEIANLRDLQTLNLAHNKLRYIPSEMLQMKKLTQLNLFPNPFLPKPPPNRDGNYVSRTERIGPKIPPLTELALRVLLSRKETRETMLEQYYELPLATSQDQRPVTAFRDILSICVPGSVLPDESRAGRKQFKVARPVTGVGICPNPMHDDESNFIRPSEERYTWVESTPAMKTKGAESGGLGGHAAVHWRGCMWGCLDFLGIAGEDEDTKKQEKEAEEEGMDLDLQESEEVVQTVRFDTATGWDFDD
ncbi:hypothetical protein BDN70DRAFT_59406 [Pholiota conissans]|uniref:Uncharacterized protein n=1 Tax=Pholiota conissans TaxID=109636 RepID=A0A9P5Z1W6_9AGAR|nr:hypothetical protein BDN70DRAFT_59406 [Pholiota conissans]